MFKVHISNSPDDEEDSEHFQFDKFYDNGGLICEMNPKESPNRVFKNYMGMGLDNFYFPFNEDNVISTEGELKTVSVSSAVNLINKLRFFKKMMKEKGHTFSKSDLEQFSTCEKYYNKIKSSGALDDLFSDKYALKNLGGPRFSDFEDNLMSEKSDLCNISELISAFRQNIIHSSNNQNLSTGKTGACSVLIKFDKSIDGKIVPVKEFLIRYHDSTVTILNEQNPFDNNGNNYFELFNQVYEMKKKNVKYIKHANGSSPL